MLVRGRKAAEGRLWMGLRFPMVGAGLESGCILVELALRLPRSGWVGSHRRQLASIRAD